MALRRSLFVVLPVLVGPAVLFSAITKAKDCLAPIVMVGDPERAKIVFQNIGKCANWHNLAGEAWARCNPPARTVGANFAGNDLDAEGLTKVIKCNMPGPTRPDHEAFSFRDDRCFGTVTADFEPGALQVSGKTFRDKDVPNLRAHKQEHMIGLREPTHEVCVHLCRASTHKSCTSLRSV